MDALSNFAKQDIALTYQWAETDPNGKARLYQEYPHFRALFTALKDDEYFLFERINPSLWPGLVIQIRYSKPRWRAHRIAYKDSSNFTA
jgi:hypothetical protein